MLASVYDPQGPLARATVDLLNAVFVVSAVILLLVTALVVIAVVRFRGRPGQAAPRQVRGHKNLEIAWTIVPLLTLAYLFILTVRAMRASDPPHRKDPDIIVVGHQFWWEVRYPKSGVVTANEIHIPAGRQILFQLGTADVIHDFWVPQLGRKMDMVPDRVNHLWLQADRPGTFQGACAEFCGTQHAWMRIRVEAQTPAAFAEWEQHQLDPARRPASPEANAGMELFRQLTCVTCHAVRGQTPDVNTGPDLTHLASRKTLGAGVLTNAPANLAEWVRNPQRFKPGNRMPNLYLTDEQVRVLTAYLLALE